MSAEPVEFGIGLVLGLVGVIETFAAVQALRRIASSLESAVGLADAARQANQQKPSRTAEQS